MARRYRSAPLTLHRFKTPAGFCAWNAPDTGFHALRSGKTEWWIYRGDSFLGVAHRLTRAAGRGPRRWQAAYSRDLRVSAPRTLAECAAWLQTYKNRPVRRRRKEISR